MANSQDVYGSSGSVPRQTDLGGSGGRANSSSSNPNDFGAQIGQETKKVGAVIGGIGNQIADFQQKQQGVINETLATEAEIKYTSELAALSGGYESLSGVAAHNALPGYTNSVNELRQRYMESVPESARHGFNMLAMRHEKNALMDANKYAVMQVKKADYESSALSIKNSITQGGYKPVANDDYRFGQTIGDIHANIARQFSDAPGIIKDEETGYFSLADTAEGKKTEKEYQEALDVAVGEANLSRYQTLADENPLRAFEKYNSEKSEIPSQYQVTLDAFFYPRVRDAYAEGVFGKTMGAANQGYSVAYANSGKSISAVDTILKNELSADGVIRAGADNKGKVVAGINSDSYPKEFAELNEIVKTKGQEAARAYAENFYQKKIIEANGIDKLPQEVQAVVADGVVNHGSKMQKEILEAAKNGASVEQIVAMRAKDYERLAATGKPEYVNSKAGWDNRLKQFASPASVRPPSKADYFKENYDNLSNDARLAAEDQKPGDVAFADLVVKKTQSEMDAVISQQNRQYSVNVKKLQQASLDENGERPASMAAIRARGGEMKQIVDTMMVDQPQVFNAMDTQLRSFSNTKKPKISSEEQVDTYNDLTGELRTWSISQKEGVTVIGKEGVKAAINNGDTSSLADLIRLQQKIVEGEKRGVTGLKPLMSKVTDGIISLVGREQGYDDEGFKIFGGEVQEPYDRGYDNIQKYLKGQNKEKDSNLKAGMISEFIKYSDKIPDDIRKNPQAFDMELSRISNTVIAKAASKGMSNIPITSIMRLQADPKLASQFDEKFGAGAANKFLGGS